MIRIVEIIISKHHVIMKKEGEKYVGSLDKMSFDQQKTAVYTRYFSQMIKYE